MLKYLRWLSVASMAFAVAGVVIAWGYRQQPKAKQDCPECAGLINAVGADLRSHKDRLIAVEVELDSRCAWYEKKIVELQNQVQTLTDASRQQAGRIGSDNVDLHSLQKRVSELESRK